MTILSASSGKGLLLEHFSREGLQGGRLVRRLLASHHGDDVFFVKGMDFIDRVTEGIPFNATGEKIRGEGLWCVYEFGQQLDAMMFWDKFKGRWLQGEEFSFPERPDNMPTLKEPKRRYSFDRKPPDLRRWSV
jgi:hypothetical protein